MEKVNLVTDVVIKHQVQGTKYPPKLKRFFRKIQLSMFALLLAQYNFFFRRYIALCASVFFCFPGKGFKILKP